MPLNAKNVGAVLKGYKQSRFVRLSRNTETSCRRKGNGVVSDGYAYVHIRLLSRRMQRRHVVIVNKWEILRPGASAFDKIVKILDLLETDPASAVMMEICWNPVM